MDEIPVPGVVMGEAPEEPGYDGKQLDPYDPKEGIKEMEAQAVTPVQDFIKPIVDGVFVIIKQTDGNYKGYSWKNGNPIEVRDIGPETVLQRLLTEDNK